MSPSGGSRSSPSGPAGRLAAAQAWVLIAFTVGLAVSISLAEISLAVLAALLLFSGRDAAGRRLAWPLWPAILAFAAITLASSLGAAEPRVSLLVARNLLLLGTIWVVLGTLRDARAAHRFVGMLFTLVAAVGVLAIVQVMLCASPHPDLALARWFFHRCERARGFFSTPLTLAGVLVMLLTATLPRLLQGDRAGGALWSRWLACAGALTVTYIRGAWIGLAAGGGLALVSTRRRLVTAAAVAGVLILLLLAMPGALQRARTIGNRSDPTTADRIAMIHAGLHMIRDHPVLGTGVGMVSRLYPRYVTPEAIRQATSHLHNTPLQILVERGAPGLVAWLLIWAMFFRRAGRALGRIPPDAVADRLLLLGCMLAIASFLVAGLFEYNFGDSEVLLVACSLMGVALAIERERKAGPPPAS